MQSDDTYDQAEPTQNPIPEQAAPANIVETRRKRGSKAGKLGGAAVRERYGLDYFARIGRQGGEKARDTHGLQFYQGIGQAGGKKIAAQRGPEFFKLIGSKGGKAKW